MPNQFPPEFWEEVSETRETLDRIDARLAGLVERVDALASEVKGLRSTMFSLLIGLLIAIPGSLIGVIATLLATR
jgi:hypothetical protein